jgi:hypothetical protein
MNMNFSMSAEQLLPVQTSHLAQRKS